MVKLRRALRRLLESTPILAANVTEASASAQKNMCTPPPDCKWTYDKDGMAHPECTDPPREPRFLGMCSGSIPLYVGVVITIRVADALSLLQCNLTP